MTWTNAVLNHCCLQRGRTSCGDFHELIFLESESFQKFPTGTTKLLLLSAERGEGARKHGFQSY
jgi:hypothetical protein